MTEEPRERAEVTVTVVVGTERKTFTADTTTTGDVHKAAEQILMAVKEDAREWINRAGRSL